MDRERLKHDVERIKKHREEKAAVCKSEREIFAALKSDGFNPKALRRLLALEQMKDRAEVEADMDTYSVALGLAVDAVRSGDLSLREAGHEYGVSKSSIHRALAVPELSREMVEDDIGKPEDGDGRLTREMLADDLGKYEPPKPKRVRHSNDFGETVREMIERAGLKPRQFSNATLPVYTDADLELPTFMDRRHELAGRAPTDALTGGGQ